MLGKILYKLWGGKKYAEFLGVKVGSNCRILTEKFGSEPWLISIGDNVTVSSLVTFVNHDGTGWLYKDVKGRRYKYSKIEIGNNVFIGANSIIMPGVKIGSNCVIGAGSVVTKSIPDGTVVAGNPARYINSYDVLMEKIPHWASEDQLYKDGSYEEKVNSIVDTEFRPFLKNKIQ